MNQHNPGSESSASPGLGGVTAKSHEAAEQLKSKLVGQAEEVRHRAESAKAETAHRIRRVATQLRSMSETLRPDDSMAASLAERASQGIEGVARYVGSTDTRGIVRDAEQMARRQPALFFGSALLLGLAAGRFLKSSSGGDVSQPRPNRPRAPERSELAPRENEGAFATGTERSSEAVQGRPSGARFKANYDATFAREAEAVRETSSTTGVGSALPRTPSASTPDKNGSTERGKGIAP